ncbi:MAG: hypothetical protein CMP43_02170 [Rickettsiales bacterium]|nr:hypothetical protein [Rickettsiales bacterium]
MSGSPEPKTTGLSSFSQEATWGSHTPGFLSPCRGIEELVSNGRLAQSRQEVFMTPAFILKTWTERTCLKWSADGSLSEHDHDELIKRLCSADPEMSKSRACGVHQDAT